MSVIYSVQPNEKEAMKVRHVRMSEAEWAKAKQLGGSRWIRDQINKAKLKQSPPAA